MSGTDVQGERTRVRGHVDADDPILTAKVTMSRLPEWVVPRPRIDKLLASGARGPLTLVSGPPGAGKTVAIASWATANSDRHTLAWVTLDEYDNRPGIFWSYVAAALRRAGVTVPRIPSGPDRDPVEHVFLVRLASVLARQNPPVALVLDDLQSVTDPVTLNGLAYVLTNARPGLRLVAASRSEPLLPLHRYRLTGELTEVKADDLAFSVRESALLLARHGVTLSPAALERLTGRTEGWAAGMRLAALSLRGHPDPGQFVKELEAADGVIAGYLVDEVLNAQPPQVREMLLQTSILDRVNSEIASELAGDQRAGDALPALARVNGFIRPLGHGWYRYHSLLADVLRLRVRLESRTGLADLYQRAARWYHRNGLLTEAVRYAAESGDWQFAAAIVVGEFAAGQLSDPRGGQRLTETFRRMPADCARRAEPLLILAAAGLSGTVSETCLTSLAAAESLLSRLPGDHEIPARLTAALVRLELSRRTGDLDAVTASAGQAAAMAECLPAATRARHPELRERVLTGRGTAQLWAGDLGAAAESFRAAIAGPPPGAWYERADQLGYLALAEALAGQLSHAAEHAAGAAQAAETGGDDPAGHITPAASVALALAHLWQADTQEAHAQLKRAKAALRMFPDRLVSVLAYAVAAQHRLAAGDAATALEMVRRARRDWPAALPGWLEVRLSILESRAYALAADVPAAVAAAQRANPQLVPDAAAALACAWLAAGDDQAARQALDTLAGTASEPPHHDGMARLLAGARLSYRAGDSARGRQSLERALRLARPERIRLPFAMERTWLRQVLRYEPELVRAFRDLLEPVGTPSAGAAGGQGVPAAGQPEPVAIERLSEREQEVLSHLSEMLSTAEIAAEMCLSVNTVKTHLRSIYRKLSAARRGEAVRRARQLELI